MFYSEYGGSVNPDDVLLRMNMMGCCVGCFWTEYYASIGKVDYRK
jgi:hypothetical protein